MWGSAWSTSCLSLLEPCILDCKRTRTAFSVWNVAILQLKEIEAMEKISRIISQEKRQVHQGAILWIRVDKTQKQRDTGRGEEEKLTRNRQGQTPEPVDNGRREMKSRRSKRRAEWRRIRSACSDSWILTRISSYELQNYTWDSTKCQHSR